MLQVALRDSGTETESLANWYEAPSIPNFKTAECCVSGSRCGRQSPDDDGAHGPDGHGAPAATTCADGSRHSGLYAPDDSVGFTALHLYPVWLIVFLFML